MLNAGQQQARDLPGHGLITACPGSGKTKTLEEIVKHVTSSDPRRVVGAVTFTKDAATSLENRIKKSSPLIVQDRRLYVGTFHGLCIRQLQRSRSGRLKLISEGQALGLMNTAIQECLISDQGFTTDDCISQINAWKSQTDPMLPNARKDSRVAVFERYQQLLRQMGVMDFADVIREAVYGMRNGTLKPIPVTDLLVDEFQDVDSAQLAWVLEHVNAGVQVKVVGDDDQSIFGFRNALGFEGMVSFQRATGAEHIALDITYRCPSEILTPASLLIEHNLTRVPKVLKTANTSQGMVRCHAFANRDEEFGSVVDFIQANGPYDQWAVLARTNRLLEDFEFEIGEAFPFHRKGGGSFWDLAQPMLFLSVLQSFQEDNLIGIDALLKRCGIGQSTLDGLHSRFDSSKRGALNRFIASGVDPDTLARGDKGFMVSFIKLLATWRSYVQQGDTGLRQLFSALSFFMLEHGQWRLAKAKTGPDGAVESDQTAQRRLHACVKRFNNLNGSLGSRLNAIRQIRDNNGPGVQLMTLHSSKGLEFNHVWILGCNELILPSPDAHPEEERRLLYVGITRGMKTVDLSYALGEAPSRFLSESGILQQS